MLFEDCMDYAGTGVKTRAFEFKRLGLNYGYCISYRSKLWFR